MWLRFFVYGGIFVAIGGYAAWPYYSLQRLHTALEAEDTETVNRLVDWPAVRAGLQADLDDTPVVKIGADAGGEAEGGIASRLVGILAPAMADMMVDVYASPQGLARLLKDGSVEIVLEEKSLAAVQVNGEETLEAAKGEGRPRAIDANGEASSLPPFLANAVSSAKVSLDEAKVYAIDTYDTMKQRYDYVFFTGADTFKAEYAPASEAQSVPLILELRLQNFQWQLVRVHLPE